MWPLYRMNACSEHASEGEEEKNYIHLVWFVYYFHYKHLVIIARCTMPLRILSFRCRIQLSVRSAQTHTHWRSSSVVVQMCKLKRKRKDALMIPTPPRCHSSILTTATTTTKKREYFVSKRRTHNTKLNRCTNNIYIFRVAHSLKSPIDLCIHMKVMRTKRSIRIRHQARLRARYDKFCRHRMSRIDTIV